MRLFALCIIAFAIESNSLQAQDTASLPKNIEKEMAFFVGDWTVEADVNGMAVKGTWHTRWSPQKHCLLIRYPLTIDGEKVSGNGIMGWDTAKKEIVILMFYSGGVHEEVRYKVESSGVLKGVFTGSAQGKAIKSDCVCTIKQPDQWTFKTTGHAIDGKQEGGIEAHFTRMKDKPKKKQAK